MLHFNVEDLTSEGVCVRENSHLSSRATVFSLSLSLHTAFILPLGQAFCPLSSFPG